MRFCYRNRGAISIFLVIILLPMLAVTSIMIDASRYQLGKSVSQAAGDLTLNTALTQYDTVLKDVYGLFAMSQNNDELMDNLEDYFSDSIRSNGLSEASADDYVAQIMSMLKDLAGDSTPTNVSDLLNTQVIDFTAQPVANSSLANPSIMRKQIVEFMKYRAPVNMGLGFLESLNVFKGMKEKKKVVDTKMTYYEKQADVSTVCKELYDAIYAFEKIDLDTKTISKRYQEQLSDTQSIYINMTGSCYFNTFSITTSFGGIYHRYMQITDAYVGFLYNKIVLSLPAGSDGNFSGLAREFSKSNNMYFMTPEEPVNVSDVNLDNNYSNMLKAATNSASNFNNNAVFFESGRNEYNDSTYRYIQDLIKVCQSQNPLHIYQYLRAYNSGYSVTEETKKQDRGFAKIAYVIYREFNKILAIYNKANEDFKSYLNDYNNFWDTDKQQLESSISTASNSLSSMSAASTADMSEAELKKHQNAIDKLVEELVRLQNELSQKRNLYDPANKTAREENLKAISALLLANREKYNTLMDQIVRVSSVGRQLINSNPDWLTNMIKAIDDCELNIKECSAYAIDLKNRLSEAETFLTTAETKIASVIQEVKKLKEAESNLNSAIEDPKLPDDNFKQSSQAEFQKISQIFKLEDLQVFKTRIASAKENVLKIKQSLDDLKFGTKPIYELTSLYMVNSSLNDSTINNPFSGIYSLKHPPIDFSEYFLFVNGVFENNFTGTLDTFKDAETPSVKKKETEEKELAFYLYLMSTYSGEENSETKGQLNDARNNLLSQSKTQTDDAVQMQNGTEVDGNGKPVGFGTVNRDLNIAPNGVTGEWVLPSNGATGGLTGQSSVSLQQTNSDDDIKKDQSKEALNSNSGFVTTLFDGFDNLIEGTGDVLVKCRDNLYMSEYAMQMFSFNTMYAEDRYDFKKKSDQSPTYDSLISIDPNSDEGNQIREMAKTLTRMKIDENNNYAFLGEVEYIVFGSENTGSNITATYASIFGIRFTLNTIYAFTSPVIRNDAFAIAVPISAATLGVFPVPLVQAVIQIGISLAETSLDMLCLKEGMPIPIYKSKETWKISSYGALNQLKDTAVSLGEQVAIKAINSASTKLQELLDSADEKLTNLVNGEIENLKSNLSVTVDNIFDEAGGSVIARLTELCNEAVMGSFGGIEIDYSYIEKELYNFVNDPDDNKFIGEAKRIAFNTIKGYIKELTEKLAMVMKNKDKSLSELMSTELNKTINKIKNTVSLKISDAIEGAEYEIHKFKNTLIDNISNNINEGKEALNSAISNEFGKLSGKSKTNPGSVASSLFSFSYSDYLRLFLFISLSINSDGALQRMADLIQFNIATSTDYKHNKGLDFRMNKAFTYINIKSEVEIKPFLITMPFVAEMNKNPQTNTNWYEYTYTGIAGY